MEDKKPVVIKEFPLSIKAARQIVMDLAWHHNKRILFGRHCRQRMAERGVTVRQIITVMRSKRSDITEGPFQTPGGDWKFTLNGVAAGERLNVVIALRRVEHCPSAMLVTVWIN